METNLPFLTEEETQFVDVILPVPIPRTFTYRVPRVMSNLIKIGARVIVEFGRNRVVTALVSRLHTTPPEKYQAKYLLELLDSEPLVTPTQLWLFDWIADYYLCNVGEVMNVALPSGLKVSSQSRIQINPDFAHPELLDEKEAAFLEILETQVSMTYEDVMKFSGETEVNKLIKSLVAKEAILLYEEIKEKYQPKTVKKLRLLPPYTTPEAVAELIEALAKAAKQQEAILAYLKFVPLADFQQKNPLGIERSTLLQAGVSESAIKSLVEKGIFEQNTVVVSRFADSELQSPRTFTLSAAQAAASEQIMEQFAHKDIVLLHGVTGSGKTEVYIDLIQQVLASGSQVLYLLPEIALTTQIVVRLKRVFGDKMGVYHSKFSDNERVEVWKGVLEGKFQFVVGVRSAVFLPLDQLGLIIVDEEHETSYKQFDPAPRYHARDVAIMLALRQQAKVVLGSATPAIETYYMAQQGRYGLVSLKERFGEAKMPDISLIDMKTERKNKTVRNDFSSQLLQAVEANLKHQQQTIIFQNRRGYSPYINCQECNWTGHCEQCAVSLTYHLTSKELVCHYCGHHEPKPATCPACGSVKLRTMGVGTEKIEDDLNEFFPAARVRRMDLDTTRSKNAYQQIIGELEQGEVDILVGTQMISKGLDFEEVNLVGIFNADQLIHFPDFRATERAFQMLTQVSGRAGRREKPGRVLIQTASATHPLLQWVINGDYDAFYETEIGQRQAYHYPPFTRVIKLTTKHLEQQVAKQAADQLAANLAAKLGRERVLGPESALVERIRNKFLFEIWLKLEKDKLNIKAAKEFVKAEVELLLTSKEFRGVSVVIDVDAI